MIRLFYRDKDIIFDGKGQDYPAKETVTDDGTLTPARAVEQLDGRPRLVVVSDDPQKSYAGFVRQLSVHPAGGGIVENPRGECLMIFRNGRWDLPKGHLEACEDIETCALREVSEECGIHGMTITRRVGLTEHIYELKGEWILKSTDWYAMRYEGNEPPVPQREEGIDRIEWVPWPEALERLRGSYATMRYLAETLKAEQR